MSQAAGLFRFINAQERVYQTALSEVRNGKKKSHWMWYIFPQIKGLGFSETSKFYVIQNLDEAAAYLHDPVLGKRLVEISKALLNLPGSSAYQIFGSPDDMKLRSSMTLFAAVPGADAVFQKVLGKYFEGSPDTATLRLIS
jgi:uncharacterized protein (DUF1810 family)